MKVFQTMLGIVTAAMLGVGCVSSPTHQWENSGYETDTTTVSDGTTNVASVTKHVHTYANRGYESGPSSRVSPPPEATEEKEEGFWSRLGCFMNENFVLPQGSGYYYYQPIPQPTVKIYGRDSHGSYTSGYPTPCH